MKPKSLKFVIQFRHTGDFTPGTSARSDYTSILDDGFDYLPETANRLAIYASNNLCQKQYARKMHQLVSPLATSPRNARNSLSAGANAARRPLSHFQNIDRLQSLTI